MTDPLFARPGNDLVIVVPLWQRTENLPRLYASIDATVPEAEVLLVVNGDDYAAQGGIADLVGSGPLHGRHPRLLLVDWPGGTTGDYARKINAGYRRSDRELIFTGADDIEFTDGWYEAALNCGLVAEALLDSRIGVVGTVDDCNARTFSGSLSTHSLVRRWYADLGTIDRDHSIYCEEYPHEYVDDELVETAVSRGAYAHAFNSVVRHHHPNAGRADLDPTYIHGRSRTRESARLFLSRRRLWSPTNATPGITTVSRPR